MQSGATTDAEHAKQLLKLLMDSSILRSCSPVFDAFDETMLFGLVKDPSRKVNPFEKNAEEAAFESRDNLKRHFKGVFQNVSKVQHWSFCMLNH